MSHPPLHALLAEPSQHREHIASCPRCRVDVRLFEASVHDSRAPLDGEIDGSLTRTVSGLSAAPAGDGALQTGDEIGPYRVVGRAGRGAMAVVYEVRAHATDELFALKVPTSRRAGLLSRFARERDAHATLVHPNIVRTWGTIDVDGVPALVLQHVAGPSLAQWLAAYRPTVDEAIDIVRAIAHALQYAHRAGLVHRDLKPANVLLDTTETTLVPRVGDFGLVKLLAVESTTLTGQALGTPAYMAPEQIRDASRVDARADLYSLGVTAFALLCGRVPYRASDLIGLYDAVQLQDRPDVRLLAPGISADLADLVDLLLQPDRDDRPASATAVLDALPHAELQWPGQEGHRVAMALTR